ncbi:restriction endonuclease subunit S [Cylindrospermopsis raciborskii]|uniref:restriction endonuclease subunit S n=1 Tax=Cylindrospermopsis raciborskii TaxID=77022 RepID=UPI000E1E98EF|nr:restriction endonuclease subunit S [Cylindrospermopsis raciborskii]UJL35041.1 restriction endonuclease subunit S [Cylindrospermopsis raciborskii Cr2010]
MSEVEIKQERGWKRYPAYKDSGVEWLGEIPEGWEVRKVSHAFQKIGSGTTPSTNHYDYYEGNIPWVNTSELREKVITDTSAKLTNKALLDHSVLNLYPPGTLLIAMYGATIGRLGILGITACTNQACCALANPISINAKFAFYWLWMRRNELILLSSGGGQPNINQEKIRSIRIPAPPLTEQQAIARFLDRETAKIDTLIAKKERLIELLKEKRTALISHAVTKGLNPDAPMKDSGIEWLGKIPEGWKMIRLKYVAPVSSVKLTQKPDHLPYLGLEHIESKTGRLLLDTPVENVESTVSCFEKGDVLFGKLRPYLAKVFLAEFQGVSTTELLALKTSQEVNGKFLFYQLIAEGFINQVNSFTYGTKMPRVSPEQITSLFITLPPLSEQQAIAQFLDRETAKIDTLVTKTRISIDKLKEYRTALISAAVTGKIDIRENLTPSPN